MKADESADCAGRWGGRLSTELLFFFSGASKWRIAFGKIGFRLGPDLAILS